MAEWSLEVEGVRKKFSEWGLTQPVIRFASQDVDTAGFTYLGRWERQDDLFAYGDTAKIFKDGVKWFQGMVVGTPIMADARNEKIEYEVRGPWMFLEEHEYQVPWTSWNAEEPGQIYSTHLLMNAAGGGLLFSTRQQTLLILEFLLDQYADNDKPFQIGTIIPEGPLGDLFIPIHEDRDITCDQAVRHQLSWHRDMVQYFDYATDTPTLHIKRASDLAVVIIERRDEGFPRVSQISLASRPDLQRPSVVIRYEIKNTINGEPRPALVVDAYPPGSTGREFGAWCATVDLVGFNKTTLRGSLDCQTLDTDSKEWWKQHEPKLAGLQVANLQITDVQRSGELGLPRELVGGQIAPWMELEDGSLVEWERETITAKARYKYYSGDPANGGFEIGEHVMELSVKLTTTNAPAGESSYKTTGTFETGDPQPIDMARYLYETVSPLYHSGRVLITEEEISGQARVGKRLRVTGGRPEWAVMNAIVQQVTEDIENGETEIVVGPPEHLGPQDLVELVKVGRRRLRWVNPNTLEGELEEMALGEATPNNDSGLGATQQSLIVVTPHATDVDGANKIKLNTAEDGSAGVELELKQKQKAGKIQAAMGGSAQKPFVLIQGDNEQGGPTILQVGSIQIDLSDIPADVPAGQARFIKLRPMTVCVEEGGVAVSKKALVLCGEAYT